MLNRQTFFGLEKFGALDQVYPSQGIRELVTPGLQDIPGD